GPGLALCQLSSSTCRRSRSASSARFFGARSWTSWSKPFQKAEASTPVPGSTSSSIKRCRLAATCKRPRVTRSLMTIPLYSLPALAGWHLTANAGARCTRCDCNRQRLLWLTLVSVTHCRDASLGYLGVLHGGHAGDTHRANYLPVDNHRHATFQRVNYRRGQEGITAAIDHVLVTLGFATADGGAAGLFGGDVAGNGGAAIQALQTQQVATVIGNGDGHGPAVVLRFGARSGEDGSDFGLTQYGFGFHVLSFRIRSAQAQVFL